MEWQNLASNIRRIDNPLLIRSGGFYTRTGEFRAVFILEKDGEWHTAPMFGRQIKGYAPEREYLYAVPKGATYCVVTYLKKAAKYGFEWHIKTNRACIEVPELDFPDFDTTRGVPELSLSPLKWIAEIPEGAVLENGHWWKYCPKLISQFPPLYHTERGLTIKNFRSVKEELTQREFFREGKIAKIITSSLAVAHHRIRFSEEVKILAHPNFLLGDATGIATAYACEPVAVRLKESGQMFVIDRGYFFITHYRPLEGDD